LRKEKKVLDEIVVELALRVWGRVVVVLVGLLRLVLVVGVELADGGMWCTRSVDDELVVL